MGYNNVDVMVSGPNKSSSTYKTKILKGNHSFASQVTEANTKYVIKYDFDLNSAEVTIPANCILEFDGGSFKNGTIEGNGCTIIGSPEYNIFNNTIVKNMQLDYFDLRWFGAIEGEDCSDAFDRAVACYNLNVSTPIKVVGHYKITRTIVCHNGINMFSDAMSSFGPSKRLYGQSSDKSALRRVASIDVDLADDYNVVFHVDRYVEGGTASIEANWSVVGIDFTDVKAKERFTQSDMEADGERTAGYFIEQQYIQAESPYNTVLFKYDGGGMPSRGFRFESCRFYGFRKAIEFTGGHNVGTVASGFVVRDCVFSACHYAMYIHQQHEVGGRSTLNFFDVSLCSFDAPSKIYATKLYGPANIRMCAFQQFYQEGDIMDNVTYPIVYLTLDNGVINFGEHYIEHNTGHFVFECDRFFDEIESSTTRKYKLAKACINFTDCKSSVYGYDIEGINRKCYYHFRELGVLKVPYQILRGSALFESCVFGQNAVIGPSLGPVTVEKNIISYITTDNGNTFGRAVVLSEPTRIISYRDTLALTDPTVRGIYRCKNSSLINNRAIFSRIEYTKVLASGTIFEPEQFSRREGSLLAPNVDYLFSFYKNHFDAKLEFLGEEINGEYEVIDSIDTLPIEGFCFVKAHFDEKYNYKIKKIRVKRSDFASAGECYMTPIIPIRIGNNQLGTFIKDCCILFDSSEIATSDISSDFGATEGTYYLDKNYTMPLFKSAWNYVTADGEDPSQYPQLQSNAPYLVKNLGYYYVRQSDNKVFYATGGTKTTAVFTVTQGITRPSEGSITVRILITFGGASKYIYITSQSTDTYDYSPQMIASMIYDMLKQAFACTLNDNVVNVEANSYGSRSFTVSYTGDSSLEISVQNTTGSITWTTVDGYQSTVRNSGTTKQRPTDVGVGYVYFDTTLSKPIWWNGTAWVDATGATV